MEAVIELDEATIKRNAIKQQVFESYAVVMMKMDKRTHDRDNTVMMNMSYENFEEYFDLNKKWFLVSFSKSKLLFAAIIRNYLKAQISFMSNKITERIHKDAFDNLFDEITSDHIDELMVILNSKYPKIYIQIEALNKNGISL